MYDFSYHRAASVADASSKLKAAEDGKLVAGGMTLIPTLKARLAQPSHLIDIAGISDLHGIVLKDGRLSVGAATKHHEIATSKEVRQAIPALAYLAGLIGDPQVRNLGTMGGSIANNDPAADYPAAVLALGANVITTRREIAADHYFQGVFATALEPGEIISSIVFPVPERAAYAKFPHPASGYAMTGVFVAQTANGVRVAVTGAGPGVFRWKEAETALAKSMNAAAIDDLVVDAEPLNEDFHAPREYRANLMKVMTKRAVAAIAGK